MNNKYENNLSEINPKQGDIEESNLALHKGVLEEINKKYYAMNNKEALTEDIKKEIYLSCLEEERLDRLTDLDN